MREKIDVLSPVVIFAFVSAYVGDLAFILVLGMLIPIIGLVFLAYFLAFHYIGGGLMVAILWHKTQGWLAKLALLIALITPLPILCIGVILAIILSNKFIAFVAEQGIIIGLGALTGGTAAVVGETAVVAARAAEAAAAAARAARVARAVKTAETTVEAGRGAVGTAESAEATTKAARTTGRAVEQAAEKEEGLRKARKAVRATKKVIETLAPDEGGAPSPEGEEGEEEISPEVLGERPLPMEELEKKLVGEEPVAKKPEEK